MRILLSFFIRELLFIVSNFFRYQPTRRRYPQKCRRPDDAAVAMCVRRRVHIDTRTLVLALFCPFYSPSQAQRALLLICVSGTSGDRGPLCARSNRAHWLCSRQRGEDRHDDVNNGWFPPHGRVHLMTRATKRVRDCVSSLPCPTLCYSDQFSLSRYPHTLGGGGTGER